MRPGPYLFLPSDGKAEPLYAIASDEGRRIRFFRRTGGVVNPTIAIPITVARAFGRFFPMRAVFDPETEFKTMKQTILTALAVVLSALSSTAANISFAWDYLNPPPDIEGFRLKHGTAGQTNILGIVTVSSFAGNTFGAGTISNLAVGKYRFWATAFTTNNVESDPSNIVFASVPAPVAGMKLLSGGNGALNFGWNPNSEADIGGYIFTYGSAGNTNATASFQVATNRASFSSAVPGTFWAYAVALTTNNVRGDPSIMVVASLPPAPANFRIAP